jgi:hypothetical protein
MSLFDDLKKIFLGPTLFRLDTILAARLVPLLYGTGLLALLLWAVTHLFATFGQNFGNGLWGLLEIIVWGALWLVALRIACEMVLIFFKAHETATEDASRDRVSSTLLEDIGDALHDIAQEAEAAAAEDDYITPATDPPPFRPDDGTPGAAGGGNESTRPMMRRTARRTPRL